MGSVLAFQNIPMTFGVNLHAAPYHIGTTPSTKGAVVGHHTLGGVFTGLATNSGEQQRKITNVLNGYFLPNNGNHQRTTMG